MNNLPKVVTQRCLEQNLNPRPIDRKYNALPTAPSGSKVEVSKQDTCIALYNVCNTVHAKALGLARVNEE